MPIGKPTPDGEIGPSPRHHRGGGRESATIWTCPSCRQQNEGRTPEQGCAHCGAGDPAKSRAGMPAAPRDEVAEELQRIIDRRPVNRAPAAPEGDAAQDRPGAASLGTGRRESKPELIYLEPGDRLEIRVVAARVRTEQELTLGWSTSPREGQQLAESRRTIPEALTAAMSHYDPQVLAYTLALGLQAILTELDAQPPEEAAKMLSSTQARELAHLLMGQLPDDWQGTPPEEPEIPVGETEDRAAARARVAAIAAGSKPAPVFREPSKEIE